VRSTSLQQGVPRTAAWCYTLERIALSLRQGSDDDYASRPKSQPRSETTTGAGTGFFVGGGQARWVERAGLSRFYETYPALKRREKCVLRVLNARSPITWSDLGAAASSVCLPARQWVKVFTDVDGDSTFVDPTRVEFRNGNQVTFWELAEAFNDEYDFLISRTVVDCDKKFWAVIGATHVVGGHYGEVGHVTGVEWLNVLPNTQAEAVLNAMCKLRASRLAKPSSPPARPQPHGAHDTPPKVTQGI